MGDISKTGGPKISYLSAATGPPKTAPVTPQPQVSTPSTSSSKPSTPPVKSSTPTVGSPSDQQSVQSSVSSTSSSKLTQTAKSVPLPSSVTPPSPPPILGFSSLVKKGKLSEAEVLSLIPKGVSDTFYPSSRIADGHKYSFTKDGHHYEVKWHSPDSGAPEGSHSEKGWSAQICVDGKYLTTSGRYQLNNRTNNTHIPIGY